jgi:hypothetical protein
MTTEIIALIWAGARPPSYRSITVGPTRAAASRSSSGLDA